MHVQSCKGSMLQWHIQGWRLIRADKTAVNKGDTSVVSTLYEQDNQFIDARQINTKVLAIFPVSFDYIFRLRIIEVTLFNNWLYQRDEKL